MVPMEKQEIGNGVMARDEDPVTPIVSHDASRFPP